MWTLEFGCLNVGFWLCGRCILVGVCWLLVGRMLFFGCLYFGFRLCGRWIWIALTFDFGWLAEFWILVLDVRLWLCGRRIWMFGRLNFVWWILHFGCVDVGFWSCVCWILVVSMLDFGCVDVEICVLTLDFGWVDVRFWLCGRWILVVCT